MRKIKFFNSMNFTTAFNFDISFINDSLASIEDKVIQIVSILEVCINEICLNRIPIIYREHLLYQCFSF